MADKNKPPTFEILPPKREGRALQIRTNGLGQLDYSELDTSWRARHRSRALGRRIEGLTGGLQLTKRYIEAQTEAETARQELELTRARQELLPLRLQAEETKIAIEIARQRGELHAAVERQSEESAARVQRRELAAQEHALAVARQRRAVLQELVAIQSLEAQLEKGEAERAKDARDDNDAFSEFFHTEQEVRRARSKADSRIEAIYLRAAAERRQLTALELDEINDLEGAAAATEDHIRRSDAADF